MEPLIRMLRVRAATIRRLFTFLWQMRLWWLIPIVTVLLLLSIITLLAVSTPLGPFIYAIF